MAPTRLKIAGGRPPNSKEQTALDPLDLNGRLYRQLGRLLDDMEAADRDERMTMPQRIQSLIAIARVQVLFSNLRKAEANDPSNAGVEVRRYAAAFNKSADANRRREADSRAPELVDFDSGGDDGDGDAA
jgi:hypothetical protein